MLMCSGLTAYSALKRLASRPERGPVLLVGLGGVGMMGLAIARALFHQPPIVADIDAGKTRCRARGRRGAGLRSVDPQARKAVMAATGGGVMAACDFAGSEKSLQFATGVSDAAAR
jgi:alcohol dehydrogenase